MIIYNITTLVSWPIHDAWREWMTTEYLPEVMATSLFSRYQLVRLMEVDEQEGPTYALQLYMTDSSQFDLYRKAHLERFQIKERNAWGDSATSFASLMEVIN